MDVKTSLILNILRSFNASGSLRIVAAINVTNRVYDPFGQTDFFLIVNESKL